jgi:hypothetical protein
MQDQPRIRTDKIVRVTVSVRSFLVELASCGESYSLALDSAAAAIRRTGSDRIELIRLDDVAFPHFQARCEKLARAAGFELNEYPRATPTSDGSRVLALVRCTEQVAA